MPTIPSKDTWAHDDDGHEGENDGTKERAHSNFITQLHHRPWCRRLALVGEAVAVGFEKDVGYTILPLQ